MCDRVRGNKRIPYLLERVVASVCLYSILYIPKPRYGPEKEEGGGATVLPALSAIGGPFVLL